MLDRIYDFIFNNYSYVMLSLCLCLVGFVTLLYNYLVVSMVEIVTFNEYPYECNQYEYIKSGKYVIKALTKESVERRLEYLDFYNKRKEYENKLKEN